MVRVMDDGQGYGYRSGLWIRSGLGIMVRVRNNGQG